MNSFAELVDELRKQGFAAYWRYNSLQQPYMVAGANEIEYLVTQENGLWMIRMTQPGRADYEFLEKDLTAVAEVISLLKNKNGIS